MSLEFRSRRLSDFADLFEGRAQHGGPHALTFISKLRGKEHTSLPAWVSKGMSRNSSELVGIVQALYWESIWQLGLPRTS